MDYTVRLTPLAEALAKGKSSVGALVEHARGEIGEWATDAYDESETKSLANLIFHSFEFAGAQFVCYPRDGGATLVVDTSTLEDMDEPLDAGPFNGFRVSIPTGDSD